MGIIAGQTAFLIGSSIEGLLYGAYVVLVGYAFMTLTWRRRTDGVDWVLLTFLLGMLLTSSVHYFFGLHALVVGFIKHGEETNGPLNYLASKAVGYPMDILLAINLILSDLAMLHRLWLVWQRRFIVLVAPALIMASYLVTFAYSVNLMAQGGRDIRAIYATIMKLCITSFSLSLLFSLTVTALLAYPIYRHTRQVAEAFGEGGRSHLQQYKSTILILVESGAMIAMGQIVNLTVFEIQYRTGHNIWELIGVPLAQIYVIVPSLIIVRVGLGLSSDQRATTATRRKASDLQFSSPGASRTAITMNMDKTSPKWSASGIRVDQDSMTKTDEEFALM